MVVEKFVIKLDDPFAIFSPGHAVDGQVLLTTSGEESTHAVRVNLVGTVHVKKTNIWLLAAYLLSDLVILFSDDIGRRLDYSDFYLYRPPPVYSATYSVITESRLLFGDDRTTAIIPPEPHVFPFGFQFRTAPLPHSCRIGSESYVSYTLQASICKPWYVLDIKTDHTQIRVVTPFDLNSTPWANQLTSEKGEKRFGLMWWRNEPLTLVVTINPSGYCLGEFIPVVVHIDNRSEMNFTDVTAELIREWKLTGQADWWFGWWGTKTWTKSYVIDTVQRDEGVAAGDVTDWRTQLEIPPDELPTLYESACEVVRLRHLIKVGKMSIPLDI